MKYPVLKGFYVGEGQIKVWCPFCQVWHFHGCEEFTKTDGEGHRVAHCFDYFDGRSESPLRATGYIVKLITRKDLVGCDVKGELKGRKKE